MSRNKSALSQNPFMLLDDGNCSNYSKMGNKSRLFTHYKLLAMNRYRWENLPEGLESRHMERFLFERGQAFFFKDDELGLMCLPSADSGRMNMYGDTMEVVVTGYNGEYIKNKEVDKGVRIRGNDLMIPTRVYIEYYAQKMDLIEQVLLRNLKQQMKPYFATATKQNELTVKNIVNKTQMGEEYVIVDKNLSDNDFDGFKVVHTGVQYLVDKLEIERKAIEAELLSFLGLNNSNTEKKERLLMDEVNSNNEYIDINLDVEFKNRELACQMINEKFGTNIKVVKVVEEILANNIQEVDGVVGGDKGGLDTDKSNK